MSRDLKKKGFTLIELLVVIAIIGMLSSIVFASLGAARSKARDAKRLSEIRELQKVLELYYDKYGSYPISTSCNATIPNTGWCNSVESLSSGFWIKDGDNGNRTLSEFIKNDPLDPQQSGSPGLYFVAGNRTYYYFSSSYGAHGQWYMIVINLENSNPIDKTDGVHTPTQDFDYGGSDTDGVLTLGVSKY